LGVPLKDTRTASRVSLQSIAEANGLSSQSAKYFIDRQPGTTSYSFMWSIPNMIPLSPDKIYSIWKALEPYDFEASYGGFTGQDVQDPNLKKRVLDSMKIQAKAEGYEQHALLNEKYD
jgi:hypothetical protein